MYIWHTQLAFHKELYRQIDKYSRDHLGLLQKEPEVDYVMMYSRDLTLMQLVDQLSLCGPFAAGLAAYLIYIPHESSLLSETSFFLIISSTLLVCTTVGEVKQKL